MLIIEKINTFGEVIYRDQTINFVFGSIWGFFRRNFNSNITPSVCVPSIFLTNQDGITPEISETLNEMIPRTSSLLQSYATLKWASTKVATPSTSNSL